MPSRAVALGKHNAEPFGTRTHQSAKVFLVWAVYLGTRPFHRRKGVRGGDHGLLAISIEYRIEPRSLAHVVTSLQRPLSLSHSWFAYYRDAYRVGILQHLHGLLRIQGIIWKTKTGTNRAVRALDEVAGWHFRWEGQPATSMVTARDISRPDGRRWKIVAEPC